MNLEGKVALVTGAGRGIGLSTAKRLAQEKATVIMADVNVEDVRWEANVLAEKGHSVFGVKAYASKKDDVCALVRTAEERYAKLDILVNNAGILGRAVPIEELTDQDWDSVMAINLRSVYLSCQAAIPGMKARHYGRIVNVASVAGKEGNPNMIPYSVAKAGVIALTKALAKEVAGDGVYVNCVSPALIETRLFQDLTSREVESLAQRIPLGRMGKPEEVAALISWLASDEASFTTGQCVDISGGRATY